MKVFGQTIRVDFFAAWPPSLAQVSVGRVSVGFAQWARPGWEWQTLGYDCLYEVWGLYPLIQVVVYDREFHEEYDLDEKALSDSVRDAAVVIKRKIASRRG